MTNRLANFYNEKIRFSSLNTEILRLSDEYNFYSDLDTPRYLAPRNNLNLNNLLNQLTFLRIKRDKLNERLGVQ